MTRYTGKNGTAGVGDTNPGIDVFVKDLGEFSRGSRSVKIGLNMFYDEEEPLGDRRDWSKAQRLYVEKARRLARATLSGSVRASVTRWGVSRDVIGLGQHNVVEFLVSRNPR